MARRWKHSRRPGRRRPAATGGAERQLRLPLDPPVAVAAPRVAVAPPAPVESGSRVAATASVSVDAARDPVPARAAVAIGPVPSDSILRLPAVKSATGLSRSTIYERIRDGRFPAPVSLGGKAVGWTASEVSAWIQRAVAQNRK